MLPLLFCLYYMSLKFPIIPSGERHFPDRDRDGVRSDSEDSGQRRGDDGLQSSLLKSAAKEEEEEESDESGALARLSSVCSSVDVIGLSGGDRGDDDKDAAAPPRPTIMQEMRIVTGYPCYVYITLGYGALTAVLIGLATFGSSFFLGLSLFDSEVGASTAFGAIVSIAGVLGFPIGGLLVDTLVKKHKKACGLIGQTTQHADLLMSSLVMTVSGSLGLSLYCLLYFVRSKALFIALIFFATTAIFVCNAATSVGLIYSIPIVNRPFGIAFNAVVMHLLGK